jgi:hypothetical protein
MRLRGLWTGFETMEFLLMMLIDYHSSSRLNRSQYVVEHIKSERRTLMIYYLGLELSKIESIPVSLRTPCEQKKEAEAVLYWIRNK